MTLIESDIALDAGRSELFSTKSLVCLRVVDQPAHITRNVGEFPCRRSKRNRLIVARAIANGTASL
jgi:hypothetical protein